jgi:LemA protein
MTFLYITLGILFVIAIYFIVTYNSIIALTNQVKNSWSNVLVQEQQKQKIIPQLLDSVKDYSKMETNLQTKITELRTMNEKLDQNEISPKDIENIERKSSEILSSIKVSVEAYPELKASDLYQKLLTEITEQQENVGASLRIFNSNVNIHNSTIKSFPINLVNNLLNKREEVTMFNNKEASDSIGFNPDNI